MQNRNRAEWVLVDNEELIEADRIRPAGEGLTKEAKIVSTVASPIVSDRRTIAPSWLYLRFLAENRLHAGSRLAPRAFRAGAWTLRQPAYQR
jgi:hypothetical protein